MASRSRGVDDAIAHESVEIREGEIALASWFRRGMPTNRFPRLEMVGHGGCVLDGLKLEFCTILCDAGEMSGSKLRYGARSIILLLDTLLDIYPFISFSNIQHQSFLQLVILVVLLYAFIFHRFGLDLLSRIDLSLFTGSVPTASFSRNAYNTLFITQSTSKIYPSVLYVPTARQYLRSLSLVSPFITSALSWTIVFSAS